MALTLTEAAKQEKGDAHRSAIIEVFAKSHAFLRELPFENIEGNALSYSQEEVLPGITFRGVNEAFTEDAGIINPVTEHLSISGGDLDVDRFIMQTMGAGQRGAREAMKVKNLAHSFAHNIIKGDSDTDARQFDGLQKRIPTTSSQALRVADGAGDPLSISQLDALIDMVDEPSHLIMSKAMRRRITQAARLTTVGGFITYDLDAFGRRVTHYNDLPIVVADENASAFASLDFTEEGTSSTSIYCVSWRPSMMVGIQNGGMSVRDLGELQAGAPAYRTRVEWYAGIAIFHPRAAARLWDITDVDAVA